MEEDANDWNRLEANGTLTLESLQKMVVHGTSFVGSKFPEDDSEIPEIWYSQWHENHFLDRMQRLSWHLAQQQLPFGEQETYKRTPERMFAYLSFSLKHKNKRQVIEQNKGSHTTDSFIENRSDGQADLTAGTDCSIDEDISFSETMFPSNCVPDSAIPV